MILYKTPAGIRVQENGNWYLFEFIGWDELAAMEDLAVFVADRIGQLAPDATAPSLDDIQAPIGSQEVWAAGVTYYKSRTARMEESSDSGGSDFYDRVYNADRPELFLKATAHRVVGQEGTMLLRKDSKWIVPEPELTLLISPGGRIQGYTVGNDLSCRDIEGENPLYLPQAKTFDRCAALGPGVFITSEPLADSTPISLQISRGGTTVFEDSTAIDQMKKTPEQLVDYMYKAASFPVGAYLMTGTGIVPPDDFTLQSGDEVRITIEPIGTLVNTVAI